MPDITVSTDIDTFMGSANNATARTNLGLGDAATKNTGTTAGTVAAGDDSRITGAVQKSGDTMTGKLTAAASDTEAKLNIGAPLSGANPSTLASGDIWISNQSKLAWRAGTSTVNAAGTTQSNTFNQPQTIGSTANAAPVLTVSNTGSREAATFTAQGTSPAVRITQTGTGESLRVEDEANPDATPFVVSASGRVGIGTDPDATVALKVDATGIKFNDGTVQTTAATGGGGSGTVTSITAGTGLTGGTITTSGTVAADFGTTAGKVTEGGTTVLKAGDTMTGKLNLGNVASTAPVNLGANVNPTPVVNGDVWLNTSNQLTWRGNNGATYPAASTVAINSFTAAQGISASTAGAVLGVTQTTGAGTAISVTQNATGTGSGITVDLNNTSSTATAVRITNQGTGASLVVEDQASVDPTPFTVSNSGRVGVGVAPDASVALSVDSTGIKFGDGTIQTTASGGGVAGVSSFSAGTTGLTPAAGTTGAVTLAGTLTEANGGTGEATYANGQLLIGNAAGGLTKATLTAGSNVTITNGDGAITIASTGGGGGGGVEESTFLSSGTWTKPVGAKSIKIYFVSAGATGGPGAKGMIGSSGPLMYGGGGGASGIFSEIELSAENVPSSMGVTIGKPVFNGAIPSFFFSGSYGGAGASVSTALTDSATSQVIYTAQNSLQMQGTLGWLNTPAAATPYQIASVSNPTSNIPSSAGVGISVNAGSSSGSSGNSSASTAVIQNAFLYGGITVSGFSGTNTKNTSAEKQRPMRWTGDIGPSCSSGGASGPSARGDATAPPMAIYNGGDGGGWFDLFTLTNVSTTYGSQNVTCASTAGLSVGMTVSGHPAIRVGNFIATINSATSFSLNTAALATASGVTLTVAAGVGGGGGGGGATTGSTPILVQGINLTSGSTTVTCTSTRGMIPLMAITGDGIPANATIASLTDETTFVLSAAATSTLTGSYAVVNGRGEISGFSISSSNSTSSAISSTLGLTWGQGLMATALTPPLSSNGTFSHVASVSPTAVTISPSATAAGSNQTLYVANAVGFLNGVNVTSGSAVVTVPNSAALQAGMLIDILWPITYSCTAGSGTLTVADTTGIATSSQRIFGPCLKTYSPMVTGFTTNTSITVTSSEVVATGTNIQGYFNRYGGVSTVPSSSGSSYVRIKSVDSLTQITLDAPMLQTHSNVTLMYAVVAGFGGIGAAGGVKIITYK